MEITVCLRECKVHPEGTRQGNDCIQPEGTRAPQVLDEGQEGLTHNSICDPVASGCSTATQAPQLHSAKFTVRLCSAGVVSTWSTCNMGTDYTYKGTIHHTSLTASTM